MKLSKSIAFAILTLACLVTACGSGATSGGDGNGDGDADGGSGLPSVSPPPDAVANLLSEKCAQRPEPITFSGTVNGQPSSYTEVLAEQDEGNVISGGSQLYAKNINGLLYVEPSSDGQVTWAARKWTLAERKEKAEEIMNDIKITSATTSNEAQAIVDHPDDFYPTVEISGSSETLKYGKRYKVCMVIQAPPPWFHRLENSTGDIIGQNQEAGWTATNSTGDVNLTHDGDGDIDVTISTGDTSITQQGSGTITVSGTTGDITVDRNGSGDVTIGVSTGETTVTQSSDGSIQIDGTTGDITVTHGGSGEIVTSNSTGEVFVEADSTVAVDLDTSTGSVSYQLLDGGVSLQTASSINTTSGDISVAIAEAVGLHLDVRTVIGSISVPADYPAPSTDEATGDELLVTDVNGGGATLTLRASTGSIDID